MGKLSVQGQISPLVTIITTLLLAECHHVFQHNPVHCDRSPVQWEVYDSLSREYYSSIYQYTFRNVICLDLFPLQSC